MRIRTIHQLHRRARWGRQLRSAGLLASMAIVLGATFVAGVLAHRQGYIWRWKHLPKQARAAIAAPPTPELRIDLKLRYVLKLQEKRNEALRRGALLSSGDDEVPATLRFGDQTVRASIRLKGDLADHFDSDKISYRVKTKDDGQFMGMRVFSLQHPRTRCWDAGWLFHGHLRREGVLTLRNLPVRVYINGEDQGLYQLEEHFSKELLESQRRREGVIVRYDESDMWRHETLVGTLWDKDIPKLRSWSSDAQRVKAFRSSKVERDADLAAMRDAAVQLLDRFQRGELPAAEVFKLDETARFLAVCELWHNHHSLAWPNVRFYYDPLEGRLEPIGYDPGIVDLSVESEQRLHALVPYAGLELFADVLRDPAFAEAYMRHVHRMIGPGYLEQLDLKLRRGWGDLVTTFAMEWPDAPQQGMAVPYAKRKWLTGALATESIALGQITMEGDAAELRLANPTVLPVEVLAVHSADGRQFTVLNHLLIPRRTHPDRVAWQTMPLPLTTISSQKSPDASATTDTWTAVCRFVGSSRHHEIAIPVMHTVMPVTGPRPVATPQPFLEWVDARTMRVRPGVWDVTGDIAVDDGIALVIEAGTTLRFEPNAVLYVSGALDCRGTAERPVRLEPRRETWAGVLVINAPPSSWEHVAIIGTTNVRRPGLLTTGGVTFYRSPLKLRHCRFTGSRGEDALNVVRSEVDARHVQFRDTGSDAFDGDFVLAALADCVFEHIGGDAVDVSGGLVRVDRLFAKDVADKAISVGEQSEVYGAYVVVRDARFGIVSKDRSRAEFRDVDLQQTDIGLAAFVKKPEYGPSSLEVTDAVFTDVDRTALAETGCSIVLENESVATSELDIDELYAHAQ